MPDYIFMLQSRLSPEQWQFLNRLQDLAQTIPVNLYLVGGAVRDLMTGAPIRDLDFAVEGRAQKLVRALNAKEFRQFHWDESRRAAEMVFQNGIASSIELARTEIYSEAADTPEVKPAPILEDLRRRDFSINAIGISLNPGSRGLLLDPTNGLADLEGRTLRVLHNYSFLHDPVRILRLVRFSTRLSFGIDSHTEGLFEMALEKRYLELISVTGAGREMVELTRENNPVSILKAWEKRALLTVFHPRLQRRGPDYIGLARLQRYRQVAVTMGYVFDLFALVLYYLLKRLRGREQHRLLRNIGLNTAEAAKVVGLEREARKVVKLLGRQRRAGPRQIYDLLTPIPLELLVFILAAFSRKKRIQTKVYNYLFRYRRLRQQLPVRELELLGVARGPKFDEILEQFFYARLEGKVRNRAEQIRYLRKLAGVGKPKKKAVRRKTKSPARKKGRTKRRRR
ncbi:MAG: hypothetical protein ACE5MH_02180 [Terriglobia bacterium]